MKHLVLATALAAFAFEAAAQDTDAIARKFFDEEVATWAADPILIEAMRAQNARTAAYGQDDIDSLDAQWRAEVGTGASALLDPVVGSAVADYLRSRVAAAEGVITEVFVMDARGLNVAASQLTSDYWQGDEAKFQQTFGAGPRAIHVSEIELDESTQTYQAQVSGTIVDPDTGEPLGALTVGLNAEALF